MSDKIKVLVLADYGCSTGFGQVASNIMQRLNATGRYDITIIGINYDPINEIDFKRWPGRIIPAVTVSDMQHPDVYGRQKVLNELGKGTYDIFFTIQDTFIIQTIIDQITETQEALTKKFATIFYYPIDATPKREWMEKCVAKIDIPVPYTNYARDETLKLMPELEDKLHKPIYHGIDSKDFYHIQDRLEVSAFRDKYFNGITKGKFLITNINRNQPRKDILRSFLVLKELRDRGRDNAMLYLHMSHDDAGGNLLVLAEHFGFKLNEDFVLPSPKVFDPNQGLPLDAVNALYNVSDVLLTTTHGEGWGLSVTEAMETRTPVVAPDNTSLTEILADNRAFLVPSGATPTAWVTMGSEDNERVRPIMDVTKAADAIERIMKGDKPDLDSAQAWVKEHSWDNVCKEWLKVFDKAHKMSRVAKPTPSNLNRQQRREMERQAKKVRI